jgi:putative ABC transport system substrate-binding protein
VKRRAFITLVGGAAAAPALLGACAARTQQQLPVIGFLGSQSPEQWAGRVRGFRQGLSETGYVEGRNVAIEYRWAEGHYDRFPALVADLVRRQVTVIAAGGTTPGAIAAKAATLSIPIVFSIAGDPVEIGLVASLNRPGGNLTGVTSLGVEVGPKQLEFLHELVPSATVIGLLVNPANPATAETQTRALPAVARTLGLELHILHASTEGDFDAVFAILARMQAGGLVISPETLFTSRSEQLAALALRHRVPTIHQFREFPAVGGLMSFGASLTDNLRHVGVYVGRILKGAKPADLPVEQVVKVEFVINLKTAKALGLTVPITLLGRADEVIE